MSPAKRFMLILAAVSLVACIAINVALGPPGLAPKYLDKYKAEHDHYLDIVKSNEYKMYKERPLLHGPDRADASDDFGDNIKFVEQYEGRPEFQAEQRRMRLYGLLFDFFNAALLVALVWRFARKPLLNFLDEKIAELREKMGSAAQARQSAEERRLNAERKLGQLPEEERGVTEETEKRLARELAELKEANEHSLAVLWQEMADRKVHEQRAAALLVKQEMVNLAVERVAEEYEARQSPEGQEALIDQFADDLENLS